MTEFAGAGTPITQAGFDRALETLRAPPEALWAVLAVETSGCGFLPDRRPKILFERHCFHRLTDGRFDAQDPEISSAAPGGYGAGGAHQYARLATALQLDRAAALQSASWGLGQIMGSNFEPAGFVDPGAMVAAFIDSEDAQLEGMAAFVMADGMQQALAAKDWATFARRYNGANYAANHYDEHLKLFCAHYQARGCPDLEVRAAQVWLSYQGVDCGGIDGLIGPNTSRAISDFQRRAGLPVDGQPDASTLDALSQA